MKLTSVLSVLSILAVLALGAIVLTTPISDGPDLSSASSPSVNGNCMEVNGVTQCFYAARMANASTTCAFKTPNATTSVVKFGASFTNTYGGTFDAELARATTQYATTTRLGYEGTAVVSGSLKSLNASSTGLVAEVVPPNSFLNLKVGSSSPTLQGSCSAVVQII